LGASCCVTALRARLELLGRVEGCVDRCDSPSPAPAVEYAEPELVVLRMLEVLPVISSVLACCDACRVERPAALPGMLVDAHQEHGQLRGHALRTPSALACRLEVFGVRMTHVGECQVR